MSIEAMKMALEALEHEAKMGGDNAYQRERDALRTAIAEAEKQEPVAWQDTRKTWVDVPLKNVLKEENT